LFNGLISHVEDYRTHVEDVCAHVEDVCYNVVNVCLNVEDVCLNVEQVCPNVEAVCLNVEDVCLIVVDVCLDVEHGAPLRLRVENQLGYKMVKWISSIEFVETYKTVGKGQGGKNEDNEYFDLLANT